MWNLIFFKKNRRNKCTYLQSRNRLRDIEKTYGYQGEMWWGWGKNKSEPWDKHTYTLFYIRYIANKDLLYTTWNSTQYSGITYMRKESEKE